MFNLWIVFSALLIFFFSKKLAQPSNSASASTSATVSATAATSTSNEIEELRQKLLSGKDFSLKELTETLFDYIFLEVCKRHYSTWGSK